MAELIVKHTQLEVYKKAFEVAGSLFEVSRTFPREETYSLTDQMRRSSRSVCANLAEAWRKRCYEAAFVAKISDAEGEAAETQVWIQFAVKCGYLDRPTGNDLYGRCEEVVRMLTAMRLNPSDWAFKSQLPVRRVQKPR